MNDQTVTFGAPAADAEADLAVQLVTSPSLSAGQNATYRVHLKAPDGFNIGLFAAYTFFDGGSPFNNLGLALNYTH